MIKERHILKGMTGTTMSSTIIKNHRKGKVKKYIKTRPKTMIKERHILKGMTGTTMSSTIIYPPHGSLLMFVIGTSQDIN